MEHSKILRKYDEEGDFYVLADTVCEVNPAWYTAKDMSDCHVSKNHRIGGWGAWFGIPAPYQIIQKDAGIPLARAVSNPKTYKDSIYRILWECVRPVIGIDVLAKNKLIHGNISPSSIFYNPLSHKFRIGGFEDMFTKWTQFYYVRTSKVPNMYDPPEFDIMRDVKNGHRTRVFPSVNTALRVLSSGINRIPKDHPLRPSMITFFDDWVKDRDDYLLSYRIESDKSDRVYVATLLNAYAAHFGAFVDKIDSYGFAVSMMEYLMAALISYPPPSSDRMVNCLRNFVAFLKAVTVPDPSKRKGAKEMAAAWKYLFPKELGLANVEHFEPPKAANIKALAIPPVAPQGTAPQGTAPQGTAPQGTAPQGSAPQGSAPQGTAPQGTAPQGAVPEVSYPEVKVQNLNLIQNIVYTTGVVHDLTFNNLINEPTKIEAFRKDMPIICPKLYALMNKIKDLDEKDALNEGEVYKHYIFSKKASGYGGKLILSGLLAFGFSLAFSELRAENVRNIKNSEEDIKDIKVGTPFPKPPPGSVLTTDFQSGVEREIIKAGNLVGYLFGTKFVERGNINPPEKRIYTTRVLEGFNERENYLGQNVRIMVIEWKYKEGIDLKDVKYAHIYEPPTNESDLVQIIGRGTRFCGQKHLPFNDEFGWKLHVFIYDVRFHEDVRLAYGLPETFGSVKEASGLALQRANIRSGLTQLIFDGAVDYLLTKPFHEHIERMYRLTNVVPSTMQRGGRSHAPHVDCGPDVPCGKARPTKYVTASLALLGAAFIALYSKSVASRVDATTTTPLSRQFFCDLMKSDPKYCKVVKRIVRDPEGFVKAHSDSFERAFQRNAHRMLSQSSRDALRKLIRSVTPEVIESIPRRSRASERIDETKVEKKRRQASVAREARRAIRQVGKREREVKRESRRAKRESSPQIEATQSQITQSQSSTRPSSPRHSPKQNTLRAWTPEVIESESPRTSRTSRTPTSRTPTSRTPTSQTPIPKDRSSQRTPTRTNDIKLGQVMSQAPKSYISTISKRKDDVFVSLGSTPPSNDNRMIMDHSLNDAVLRGEPLNFVTNAKPNSKVPNDDKAVFLLRNDVDKTNIVGQNGKVTTVPKMTGVVMDQVLPVGTSVAQDKTSSLMAAIPAITDKSMNFLMVRDYVRVNFQHALFRNKPFEHPPKNQCPINDSEGVRVVSLAPPQEFLRHFFTPSSAPRGMLIYHGVGTGKTCSALAICSEFVKAGYRVFWVTKRDMQPSVYRNMYQDICNDITAKYLRDHGEFPSKDKLEGLTNKIMFNGGEFMTYLRFSNMMKGGNKAAGLLRERPIFRELGGKDTYCKTLFIVDEAHLMVDKRKDEGLPNEQLPDMRVIERELNKSYEVSKKDSARIILMTATPIASEDPMELINLLRLCIPKGPGEHPLPSTIDKFIDRFTDRDGNFIEPTRENPNIESRSAKFLDIIAGTVSFLNKEKDASQFAIPTIQKVIADMSLANQGAMSIETAIFKKLPRNVTGLSDRAKEALARIKARVDSTVEPAPGAAPAPGRGRGHGRGAGRGDVGRGRGRGDAGRGRGRGRGD